MPVIKGSYDQKYTVIPNSTLQDNSLSYEARGVLSLMLSMPEDWAMYKTWLVDQCKNTGKDKMTRMLKELEQAGYLHREKQRNDKGHFDSYTWYIFPEPVEELKAKPESASAGNGSSGNGSSGDGSSGNGSTATTKETDIQSKQDTKDTSSLSANKFTDDDTKLAKFMFNRIKSVLTKAKKPNFEKWANDIRLMRERDGLTHKEIQNVFIWANKDSFWQTNIASPAKLRDKFDTLHAKANIQPKDIDEVAHRPAVPLRVPEPAKQLSDKERAENLAKIAEIKEAISND